MMVQPQAPDLPGYRDVTLIASGSTSLVFRAVQTRLSRTVAIKVLLVDDDSPTQAQYQRELETTVLLSSQPHIVGIIDTGTTQQGNPYIVMEYCPGGSYAQILKQRGPLPVDEVVDVGTKIAEALQAAHDVGVIHRDVKPSNILRSAFGPALADFGIARAPHQLLGTVSMDRMTPHHASPEAMRKDNQSPASDLYSLASTMWHLLAGRPPFSDPNRPMQDLDELRQKVLHEPAPPVPRPDVPAWLQRELARALAKDPAQRHPSAHTFAEILRYHAYRSRDEEPAWQSPSPTPDPQPGPVSAAPYPGSAPPFPGSAPPFPGSAPPYANAPVSAPGAPVSGPPTSAPPTSAPPTSAPPGGWPAGPGPVPRSAFRWPAAAPTRRSEFSVDPAPPPPDPAVAEVAADPTITWSGPPDDPARTGGGTRTADRPEGTGPPQAAASAPATTPPVPDARPQERPEAGAGEGAGERSVEDARPSSGMPASAALRQPTEQRPPVDSDRPGDGAGDRTFDRPADRPVDRPGDHGFDRPADRPGDQAFRQAFDRPADRTFDRPMDRPVDRPGDHGFDRPADRGVEAGPVEGAPPIPNWATGRADALPVAPWTNAGPQQSEAPPVPEPAYNPPGPGPYPPGPPYAQPSYPPPVTPTPGIWRDEEPPKRSNKLMVVLVAAVTVLAVIVVIGVIVGLQGGSNSNKPQANGGPTGGATATGTLQQTSTCTPTNVKLTDDKDSITLTWKVPAGCAAPLVILGGPRGAQPTIQKQLDPGTETLTLHGLNNATDYCYLVLAVVSAQGYAQSPQVCTKRF